MRLSTRRLGLRARWLKFSTLAIVLSTAWPVMVQAVPDPPICTPVAEFTAPPPAPVPTSPGSVSGFKVFEGATPPDGDPGAPVLVFVHGLHGSPADWGDDTEYHGHNDMYDTAYARGYKTFFVNLTDPDGVALDGLTSGLRLADQIEAIAQYWGVNRVNVVAHSKGGVDANVAAVAGGRIDTVVSLGSPHHGSPLADLAQTDWLEWLAELLGANDAGTKFLQTECMNLFRQLADSRPENDDISIYTSAGTSWGPALSALSFGGLYLAGACGSNDGLVCVSDANHPLSRDADNVQTGEHRVVWDWSGEFELDHDNIRKGNALVDFIEIPFVPTRDCRVPVFDSLEPYFGTFHLAAAPLGAELTGLAPARRPGDATTRPLSQILRGGPLPAGGTTIRFPVENGVARLDIELLVSERLAAVTLVAPDGRRMPSRFPNAAAGGLFAGAFSADGSVETPLAGNWRIEIGPSTSDAVGAYAMVAALDSALSLRLKHESIAKGGTGRSVWLRFEGDAGELQTEASVAGRREGGLPALRSASVLDGPGDHRIDLDTPGIHTLSLTTRGRTREGWAFERSSAVSVAVVEPNAVSLPAACQ